MIWLKCREEKAFMGLLTACKYLSGDVNKMGHVLQRNAWQENRRQ